MMMTMMSAKGYDVSSRDIYGKTTATLPASCPPCALHIVHIHGRSALFPLHCAHTWTITNCTCTHICLKVFCTHCKRLSNGYFVHYGKEVQCGECGAGLRSHDNMDWGPHVSWSWHWWSSSPSWSSSQFWPYHEKFITMILASKKKLLHNCTSSTNPGQWILGGYQAPCMKLYLIKTFATYKIWLQPQVPRKAYMKTFTMTLWSVLYIARWVLYSWPCILTMMTAMVIICHFPH